MKKEHVNLRKTRVWEKCNEDSRAHLWREKFVNMHGGEFKKRTIHIGSGWKSKKNQKKVWLPIKNSYTYLRTQMVEKS